MACYFTPEHRRMVEVGADIQSFRTVGIKDRRIPDSAMTASSNWADGFQAYYGRMDNSGEPRGFWHPASGQNENSWIQVDFGVPTRIVGVITQGRPTLDDWVTSYKILFGNHPQSLASIQTKEFNGDLVFQGNRDRNTKVANLFPFPVTARFFRLQVLSYTRMPVLRLEFLTC